METATTLRKKDLHRTTIKLRVPLGVDASHHQGAVDWRAVAGEGFAFAFLKATEGANTADPVFASNWVRAKEAGLLRGGYHFYRAATDPRLQANNFLETVRELSAGDLPPMLDVEVLDNQPASTVLDGVQLWLATVELALKRKPIVYSYPSFWRSSMGNSTRLAEYPLWIAHYTLASEPSLPGGWKSWTFWQYSDHGRVAGVAGPIDFNRFHGTQAELRTLAGLPAAAGAR
ncbi:MAG TPA: glycoside hydrolase family 25 protein [Terriglobales bacterium]|nr:glycoside hydrolase family 25 protein [Terriglobales bacterium]